MFILIRFYTTVCIQTTQKLAYLARGKTRLYIGSILTSKANEKPIYCLAFHGHNLSHKMEKNRYFLHMGKASYVTMNNYNNGWRNSLQHQLHDNDYIFGVLLSLLRIYISTHGFNMWWRKIGKHLIYLFWRI